MAAQQQQQQQEVLKVGVYPLVLIARMASQPVLIARMASWLARYSSLHFPGYSIATPFSVASSLMTMKPLSQIQTSGIMFFK